METAERRVYDLTHMQTDAFEELKGEPLNAWEITFIRAIAVEMAALEEDFGFKADQPPID